LWVLPRSWAPKLRFDRLQCQGFASLNLQNDPASVADLNGVHFPQCDFAGVRLLVSGKRGRHQVDCRFFCSRVEVYSIEKYGYPMIHFKAKGKTSVGMNIKMDQTMMGDWGTMPPSSARYR
jgi:hypothetical protein